MTALRTALALAAAAGTLVLGAAAGTASASAGADGLATNSPGVLSGNVIQIPVHIPVNVCGNSIGVVSILNPATGNACANADG
ncbi:chaplin [Kitasatospora sp. DSM 101779]|uniref:chaplin n=1 Tax=Kitasatospora sp. DSM 101779 TaxID=2853165 RepID=UPI0021DB6980|nr:chaplin [Kitasatospora sp. DSM 101779]MCU7826321.1 chaplin [Kitasatospora sp. DSM 101779]